MSNDYDNRGCCSVDGCTSPLYAKSMCERHYARVRRNGSPYVNKRTERRDPVEWLWSNYMPVPECGCWLWEGATSPEGYGYMKVGPERVSTHRMSYELVVGLLSGTDCVLHRCDTPSCINPRHLFVGTRTDNNADKMRKGRHVYGADSPFAKLTDDAVRAARESDESLTALAAQNGVSHETMRKAVLGHTWRHVK